MEDLVDRANEPDELLDLVDAADRPMGTVRKGVANADPRLHHREVAILIHRDAELLWQQRSWAKTVMPGVWDIACAGHVPAGVAPEAAAHQELREELGFDTELVFVERRLVKRPNETYFAYVYDGAAPSCCEPEINRDEVQAIEWCDRVGFTDWQKQGRAIGEVARDLAEAFWARSAARA
jgi:isopentenyldiphosphate isomerase